MVKSLRIVPDEEVSGLVALRDGLAPHAGELACDDVRGPRSLFGEAVSPPRPIEEWPPYKDARSGYGGACVLWKNPAPGSTPLDRARCIATLAEEVSTGQADRFAVPSLTVLAGQCDSAFSVAWKLARDGLLPEWGAVLCSCQTEGRGQLRRSWFSPRGNLYVTFRLPADSALQGDTASLVTGYLMARAFKKLGFPVSIKWPNDLLLEDRVKIGGILLEENDGLILAGMGVNLAEAPPREGLRRDASVPAAVLLPRNAMPEPGRSGSVRNEKMPACFKPDGDEEPLAPFVLWQQLVSRAILEYNHAIMGKECHEVLPLVEGLLAWKGREVAVGEERSGAARGRILGLGLRGELILRRDDGGIQACADGSIFTTD